MEARWAIFGLLDATSAVFIRRVQTELSTLVGNDRALRFPVHVTIRGRFIAREPDAESFFQALARGWSKPLATRLCAPSASNSGVAWLGVSNAECQVVLRRLHCDAERRAAALRLGDEVPPEHKLRNYEPHVTLAWDCQTAMLDRMVREHGERLESLRASVVDLALVRYPTDWYSAGQIEVWRRTRTARTGRRAATEERTGPAA